MKRLLYVGLVVKALVFFAVVFVYAADRDTVRANDSRIPGQYIIVFKDGVTDAVVAEADLLKNPGVAHLDSYRNALRGFSARLTPSALTTIQNDSRVAFVSEDHVLSVADTRDRNVSAEARGTPSAQAAPQTLPTGVDRINAENKVNKGAGVNVAVIDTGIYLTHPDLKDNIVGGKNCVPFALNYNDQNGHGTHVAGTIAAINNTQGVVGVAPQAKLWAVRVLDRWGNGSWSSVICGLDFVTSKAPQNGGPIKVANLSLGGSGSVDNNCGNTNNDALHKAICRTRDAGVAIVVAAGNNSVDASTFIPAGYNDAVITVSALADSNGSAGGTGVATSYGADDTFASFSNFGSAVDIGAPGVNINSTWLNNGYATISGTSMATPHVAGAAALYIATHPSALWLEVRDALVAAGETLGSGHTDPSGIHPEPVLKADTL